MVAHLDAELKRKFSCFSADFWRLDELPPPELDVRLDADEGDDILQAWALRNAPEHTFNNFWIVYAEFDFGLPIPPLYQSDDDGIPKNCLCRGRPPYQYEYERVIC